MNLSDLDSNNDSMDGKARTIIAAISKTILQQIPIANIASTFMGELSSAKQNHETNCKIEFLEEMLVKLGKRLEKLELQINENSLVMTDLYKSLHLIESGISAASSALHRNKIGYLAEAVTNGLLDIDPMFAFHKKCIDIIDEIDEIDVTHLKFYSLFHYNDMNENFSDIKGFYDANKHIIFSLQYYDIADKRLGDIEDNQLNNERINCPMEVRMLSFHSASKLLRLGLVRETRQLATYSGEDVNCINHVIVLTDFGKHILEVIRSVYR